jgi:hypothetical protein
MSPSTSYRSGLLAEELIAIVLRAQCPDEVSSHVHAMSGLTPTSDIDRRTCDVPFVPITKVTSA